MTKAATALMLAATIILGHFSAIADDKLEKKRDKILEMRERVLAELYEARPQAKAEINAAEGYAVFSNVGLQVIFFGAGGGRGVIHDSKTGMDTYMNMATGSVGLGIGIKDFHAVFIFHDRKALVNFTDNGWDLTAEADVAAIINDKQGDIGGAVSDAGSVRKKVSVYQFTENGLALQASLHGTKYWQSKKLNRK